MTVASIVEWFLWQNFIKKSELSPMMYVKPAGLHTRIYQTVHYGALAFLSS